jgi:toxin ParE1/3/4
VKVLWTLAAEQDRADILDFIAADNPVAAIRMDEVFEGAVRRLEEHPRFGRVGQIAGTRELVPHESYRLIYEAEGDTVWILALIHTARRWPPARR